MSSNKITSQEDLDEAIRVANRLAAQGKFDLAIEIIENAYWELHNIEELPDGFAVLDDSGGDILPVFYIVDGAIRIIG